MRSIQAVFLLFLLFSAFTVKTVFSAGLFHDLDDESYLYQDQAKRLEMIQAKIEKIKMVHQVQARTLASEKESYQKEFELLMSSTENASDYIELSKQLER